MRVSEYANGAANDRSRITSDYICDGCMSSHVIHHVYKMESNRRHGTVASSLHAVSCTTEVTGSYKRPVYYGQHFSVEFLGSILTNDGRCTCEIKCRIAMAKAAFNKKRALFTSTLDLELRKKLVKCYIWKCS